MAGPDLPSGGTSPPPGTPPTRSRKRKRGDDDAGPPSSLPRRSTRISASASARQDVDEAVDSSVRLARGAAAGSLRSTTTRGRDHADVERMRKVILEVRQPSFPVPADDADSPYPKKQKIHRSGTRSSGRVACQISYLSSYPKKRVGTDPVMHLASVPEWKNDPSEEDTADYKAETLQKLGTIVCPLNMDISSTDEPEKTRIERVDKCNCSHPGSEDCVRVHVKKARSWIKDQLGEEAFGNCGLDAMGEHAWKLWTAKDKRKLDNIDKLIPQKKHKKFMKIALKQLSQKKTKDLAKYYYNVFLPRRLASLTRAEPKKDEDVDTDEEDSSQDDNNNGHRSRKKSKSSGSSSKRVAEILAGVVEVDSALEDDPSALGGVLVMTEPVVETTEPPASETTNPPASEDVQPPTSETADPLASEDIQPPALGAMGPSDSGTFATELQPQVATLIEGGRDPEEFLAPLLKLALSEKATLRSEVQRLREQLARAEGEKVRSAKLKAELDVEKARSAQLKGELSGAREAMSQEKYQLSFLQGTLTSALDLAKTTLSKMDVLLKRVTDAAEAEKKKAEDAKAEYQRRLDEVDRDVRDIFRAGRIACRALWEDEPVPAQPTAVAERLKWAPNQVAMLSDQQYRDGVELALVVTKSHYPAIALEDIQDGVAADATDEEVAALQEEVKPAAAHLVSRTQPVEGEKEE